MLNPETRNVKQVVISDVKAAAKHLEMLMGAAVAGRREFLLANGNKANDLYEKKEDLNG